MIMVMNDDDDINDDDDDNVDDEDLDNDDEHGSVSKVHWDRI